MFSIWTIALNKTVNLMYLICPHFPWKVSNQRIMFKVDRLNVAYGNKFWCSMFKIDRCSMYPGSLPFIFNGSLPGNEKVFNVRRCSMYTGVQFGRFHCTLFVLSSHIILPTRLSECIYCILLYYFGSSLYTRLSILCIVLILPCLPID